MRIARSITEPIRQSLSWEKQWKDCDQGLIACWERGREKSNEDPTLAAQARDARLVALPHYLAMWQGLRGDDLNITFEEETALTCPTTQMTVVFTNDSKKYAEA